MLKNVENENFMIDSPRTTIAGLDELIGVLKNQSKNLESEEKLDSKRIMETLNKTRASISIELRRESKKMVDDEIRGKVIPESLIGANFERIDYNEDSIFWVDFKRNPHNCHTLVLDKEYGINGITEPKGVRLNASDLNLISLDGKNPASSLDFVSFMYEELPEERRENFAMDVPGRKKDGMIIGKFLEYVKLYENSRNSPEEFVEEALKLQDEIIEKFPKFGAKSTPEELRAFQAEISDKQKNLLNKEQEEGGPKL